MAERRRRIPELDGLRVLMIFIVSWYHIWQQSWLAPVIELDVLAALAPFPVLMIRELFPGVLPVLPAVKLNLDWLVRSGYVWVDGTILLSVFLLYLPWAEAKRAGAPGPDTKEFYYRRARRVIPAYWFIVIMHLAVIALPWGLYRDRMPFMVKDLATHLTFTFTQFSDTYQYSNLGGAAWTLAILVQGYVLFPLIAAGMRKKPVVTLVSMALVCWGFRAWCLWGMTEYQMVVNQLIDFLDVYVLGILLATAYTALRPLRDKLAELKKRGLRFLWEAGATVMFFAFLYALVQMLKVQAQVGGSGLSSLQAGQMMYRPVFALCFGGLIFSAPFALLPLRKALGNPVSKFLGMVSMNYYLVHQTVAVHLKSRLKVPYPLPESISYGRPVAWQYQYTWLCIGVALVMATAVTYLIEKPGAKLMDRIRYRKKKE